MEILFDKLKCTGCSACANICPRRCISMIENKEGFLYPSVNENLCVICGLCKSVCPVLKKVGNIKDTVAYACYNKNDKTRKISSSGGIFSLLAEEIIKHNGVVFGVSFNDSFLVEHKAITNLADLSLLCGSKYLQSKIGNSYIQTKKYLDEGRTVYFSGTPCQINGLVRFLGKSYDNLITQDIICHGVPSPKFWADYLNDLNEIVKEKPIYVSFRNKERSWSQYEFAVDYPSKTIRESHHDNIYMKAFLNDLILRDSCYECSAKGFNRTSDITLADFWGIDSIKPEMGDDKGISLVIINSSKGLKLFESIQNEMVKEQVDFESAIKNNPYYYISARNRSNKDRFFNVYKGENLEKVVSEMTNVSFAKKVIRKVKKILKRISR